MSAFRFSAVEKQIMEDVFDSERMRATIPGIADVQDAAALMRSMNEEAEAINQFHTATGFSSAGHFQLISMMDTNIQIAVDELHDVMCDCGRPGVYGVKGHKEFLYAWLESEEGKPYNVRGKVVV